MVGSVDAALDARGLAHRIDLEHLVHVAHRDRHDLLERGRRLDALHHRGAAAIGNRLGADLVAPVEHAHDVLLVLREGHGIGRIGHRAHEHAAGVEARLAVAMLQPRQVVGAHDRLQRRRHRDARRAQRDLLRLGRRRHIEAVQPIALGDVGLPRLDLVCASAPRPHSPRHKTSSAVPCCLLLTRRATGSDCFRSTGCMAAGSRTRSSNDA